MAPLLTTTHNLSRMHVPRSAAPPPTLSLSQPVSVATAASRARPLVSVSSPRIGTAPRKADQEDAAKAKQTQPQAVADIAFQVAPELLAPTSAPEVSVVDHFAIQQPFAAATAQLTLTQQEQEEAEGVQQQEQQQQERQAAESLQQPSEYYYPEHDDQSHAASTNLYSYAHSSNFECHKDHNSVTIKAITNVKDAAGAIVKVLDRLMTTFVTALRLEPSHESMNRAVKAIAVARKYIKDMDPGYELSFLPLNRTGEDQREDPNLFAFLTFKTVLAGRELKEYDDTDLNVSRGSDPNAMANAIIRIVKERGQAVMKAGGGAALFVAMTAVANARKRLKRHHDMDVMLVPQFITEDTRSTLGRESKFLRFNVLPCEMNGPLSLIGLSPADVAAQGAQALAAMLAPSSAEGVPCPAPA